MAWEYLLAGVDFDDSNVDDDTSFADYPPDNLQNTSSTPETTSDTTDESNENTIRVLLRQKKKQQHQ